VPSRLTQFRAKLAERQVDVQRLYKFEFDSVKLKIFQIQLYIVSVNHPVIQYNNTGDYRGLIDAVTKPGEISIGFVEDDDQTISRILDVWDSLKYNLTTGIHFPKSVYEDKATLTYLGHATGQSNVENSDTFQAIESSSPVSSSFVDLDQSTTKIKYEMNGFYPINRESIQLSYDNNAIEVINVTFNVDDVTRTGSGAGVGGGIL